MDLKASKVGTECDVLVTFETNGRAISAMFYFSYQDTEMQSHILYSQCKCAI